MISILIIDTVTIHSAWKVQKFENVCVCVCVYTTSQAICNVTLSRLYHVALKNNLEMFSNKFIKQYRRSVTNLWNLWDLPSSLSTSFCNFCTDLSANSARASAWQNKHIIKNSYFTNSLPMLKAP